MAGYTDQELAETIEVYFKLLKADKAGKYIEKKLEWKRLEDKYKARVWTSYEAKGQEISEVMNQLGLPYVGTYSGKGLKPRTRPIKDKNGIEIGRKVKTHGEGSAIYKAVTEALIERGLL